MRCFSYQPENYTGVLYYAVHSEIQSLQRYFYKFNGARAPQVMQDALMHTLRCFSPSEGNTLRPYLKKLAREMGKDNRKTVPVDFLDQTVETSNGIGVITDAQGTKVHLTQTDEVGQYVVEKIVSEEADNVEIVELALVFMQFFTMLCEALISKDTTSQYFSDVFIKETMKLSAKTENFNAECLSLYHSYKDDFDEFLNADIDNEGEWKEADMAHLDFYSSHRVKLVDLKGNDCKDADSDYWAVAGNIGDRRVLRVPYYKVYDKMCDLIDEDGINVMKFTIGYSYIVRTLGGSWSVINPILWNMYDVCKSEILTNLLSKMCYCHARLLNIGSKCMYFLADPKKEYPIPKAVVKGIPIEFEAEDITDKCVLLDSAKQSAEASRTTERIVPNESPQSSPRTSPQVVIEDVKVIGQLA